MVSKGYENIKELHLGISEKRILKGNKVKKMYGVGDTIVYGTKGVCRIEKTEQRYVRGEYRDYLVLCPVFDRNSTIYVPADNEASRAKMRPLTDADEVRKMIGSVPEAEAIWLSDDNERKQHYLGLIDQCDRMNILRIIITLHVHRTEQAQRGRRLHQADEVILKQAEKLLYDEFAFVLGISPDEAAKQVEEKIIARG